MVSELSSRGLGWLASALAGGSLGGAVGWACRAWTLRKRGFFRGSRSSVSFLFVSLSIAVAAGASLLVFPPKDLLSEPDLWIWAGALSLVGFVGVLIPRWFGVPFVMLALTALGLACLEASAWHPLVPDREAARFVPYEVGAAETLGDLSVPDRNAVPVLSKISVRSRDCVLEARVVDLGGPLAALFGEKKYILIRILDGTGTEQLRFPEKKGPLRRFLAPGDVKSEWIAVRASRSGVQPLSEFKAVSWTFDRDGNLKTTSP